MFKNIDIRSQSKDDGSEKDHCLKENHRIFTDKGEEEPVEDFTSDSSRTTEKEDDDETMLMMEDSASDLGVADLEELLADIQDPQKKNNVRNSTSNEDFLSPVKQLHLADVLAGIEIPRETKRKDESTSVGSSSSSLSLSSSSSSKNNPHPSNKPIVEPTKRQVVPVKSAVVVPPTKQQDVPFLESISVATSAAGGGTATSLPSPQLQQPQPQPQPQPVDTIQRTWTDEQSTCDVTQCRLTSGICIDCTKCSVHCTCNKTICIDCNNPENFCNCDHRLPALPEGVCYETACYQAKSLQALKKPASSSCSSSFSESQKGETCEAIVPNHQSLATRKSSTKEMDSSSNGTVATEESSTKSSSSSSSLSPDSHRSINSSSGRNESSRSSFSSSTSSSSSSSSSRSTRSAFRLAPQPLRSVPPDAAVPQSLKIDDGQKEESSLMSSIPQTATKKSSPQSDGNESSKNRDNEKSTEVLSDIDDDDSTVVFSNEAFNDADKGTHHMNSLAKIALAGGNGDSGLQPSENKQMVLYAENKLPSHDGENGDFVNHQDSMDSSNLLIVSVTGDHSELTDPEDQSTLTGHRRTMKARRRREPVKRLSVCSQFWSGCITSSFVLIVLGGIALYVVRMQGWWDPLEYFVSNNNPDSSNSAAPSQSPMTSATVAPVSPIFPVTESPSPILLPPTIVVPAITDTPTITPTQAPTKSPTKQPSKSPIDLPTRPPTKAPSASPTTSVPTITPTRSIYRVLMTYLIQQGVRISDDAYAPQNLALSWLSDFDGIVLDDTPSGGLESMVTMERFAVVTLKFALMPYLSQFTNLDSPGDIFPRTHLHNSKWIIPQQNECSWEGVICDITNSVVKEIRFGSKHLEGRIPAEIRYLKNLTVVDLSDNNIRGRIPESFYTLTNLQQIYLYQNAISGTLSSSMGSLNKLTTFITSDNQISGPIPYSLRSGADDIKPLKYFNVYSNQMTGIIPESLRWRNLFLLDLGRNQFSGTLPSDLGDQFARLRHLHLDHNNFHGTLPESYISAGNGRLETLTVDNNQLTGAVPGDHVFQNILVSFTFHENQFAEMDRNTCKQSVFDKGEMVEMKADCDICRCNDIFCEYCNQ